ncbi:MAG: tetratricopeptide repeat protein [Pirellulales bacterium]
MASSRSLNLFLVAVLPITALCAALGWVLLKYRPIESPQESFPEPDFSRANAWQRPPGELLSQIKTNPTSASQWGAYGEFLMVHEWDTEALRCFAKAAELEPKQMRWPYLSGVIEERPNPTDAVKFYRIAVELDKGYAAAHYRLGKTLLRLNKVQEAAAAFNKAAEAAPESAIPLIALSRCAESEKKWDDAESWLQKAHDLVPTNREAIVELTRLQMLKGKSKGLDPDAQRAVLAQERYEVMPDPIFDQVQTREAAARMLSLLADSAAQSGDQAKAAAAYSELIKQRPDLPRPRMNLGSLYLAQGQLPLAMLTLREAVEKFPNDAQLHYMLSLAQESLGDTAEAEAERRMAVKLKPDFAEAHYGIGVLVEQKGSIEEAVNEFRQAVSANPRYAQAHLSLGQALKKQKKWDEAIAAIEAAVRLAPGDPVPRSFLNSAKAERDAEVKSDAEAKQ